MRQSHSSTQMRPSTASALVATGLLVLTMATVSLAVGEAELFPSVDWTGARSFRQGKFQESIDSLRADTAVIDSGFHLLKLGLAYFGLNNNKDALKFLRMAAQKSPMLSALAYEFIGDTERRMGRPANAVLAYRAALQSPNAEQDILSLHRKIYEVLKSDSTLAAQISWFREIEKSPVLVKADWMPQLLDTLISAQQWLLVDSILDRYVRANEIDKAMRILDVVVSRSVPDSALSTKRLYSLAQLSFRCRLYKEAAAWLERAEGQPDFADSVPQKEYLSFAGTLNYRLGNQTKCIKILESYQGKFGLTPEVVLTLARAYRALGKEAKANVWYDKHVELYPSQSGSYEILWYRAWLYEESGRHREALRVYQRLSAKKKGFSKADQALFRSGLSYYRTGALDSALVVFSSFPKKFPQSGLLNAAEYWRAQMLLGLKRDSEARPILLSVIRNEPTGYYAYRSRQIIGPVADTVSAQPVSLQPRSGNVRAWLDSIASPKPLSSSDSVRLRISILLASIGMVERAHPYFDGLAAKYPENLSLQFDISWLYRLYGNPTLSYRIGRRLAWRIPVSARAGMPSEVFAVLYPSAFDSFVQMSAPRYGVDPFLVYAVMRQESIFDPAIVSPVGAVGLMQIMPYTGKEIAKELGESFHTDSLYIPALNVRYGAYYLSRLLHQFDGNLVLAIASYNGGPHNARRWHAQGKEKNQDLFIEDIGFGETREYVKKVLANYWTYQTLFSQGTFLGICDSDTLLKRVGNHDATLSW